MNKVDWTKKVFNLRTNAIAIMVLSVALMLQAFNNDRLIADSKQIGYDKGWKSAVLECKRGNILRGPLILSGGVISNVTFHIVHIMDEPMLAIADNSNSFKAEVVEVYNDNGGAMWIGKVERPTTTE